MKVLVLLMAVFLIGCSVTKEPRSAIVQKAQSCGAGELAGTPTLAVQDWFSKHKDCAVTVDQMCNPVRASAPAAWLDSTEGRVCLASRNVAQWVRKPSQDHETFQGGRK